MRYVNVVFRNTNSGAIRQASVLCQEHWSVTQIESVARATTGSYDDYECRIPEYGYVNNPKGTVMQESAGQEMVPAENQALWCEIKDHAFSAKDEDKMFVKIRGVNRLGCGPCSGALFQPSAPPVPVTDGKVHGSL